MQVKEALILLSAIIGNPLHIDLRHIEPLGIYCRKFTHN